MNIQPLMRAPLPVADPAVRLAPSPARMNIASWLRARLAMLRPGPYADELNEHMRRDIGCRSSRVSPGRRFDRLQPCPFGLLLM